MPWHPHLANIREVDLYPHPHAIYKKKPTKQTKNKKTNKKKTNKQKKKHKPKTIM